MIKSIDARAVDDVSYSSVVVVTFRRRTTVKSRAAKKFALYNKVTDPYHAEYIICIHCTARLHAPRRENINTAGVSAANIAYMRDTTTFQPDLHENRAIKTSLVISFMFCLPFIFMVKRLQVVLKILILLEAEHIDLRNIL